MTAETLFKTVITGLFLVICVLGVCAVLQNPECLHRMAIAVLFAGLVTGVVWMQRA
jgi:CII-binding regulator of phage lambda lysogenization HflD